MHFSALVEVSRKSITGVSLQKTYDMRGPLGLRWLVLIDHFLYRSCQPNCLARIQRTVPTVTHASKKMVVVIICNVPNANITSVGCALEVLPFSVIKISLF